MKHLITNNDGGFPFDLDDYRFMEAGFNEDITSILKGFQYSKQDPAFGTPPDNSFILYGCKISTENIIPPGGGVGTIHYKWTEGAVMIDGVIYKVNAHTTTTFPLYPIVGYYFETSVVYDNAGNENFKNGTLHQTYGIRTATPVLLAMDTSVNKLLFDQSTPRFLNNIQYVNHNYLPINPHGGGIPDYSSNWTDGSIALGHRKNEIGQVEFKGRVKRTAGLAAPIFMLTSDYCPSESCYFTIPNITANTAVTILINLLYAPGGTFAYVVLLDDTDVGVGDELDFSSVRFSTV